MRFFRGGPTTIATVKRARDSKSRTPSTNGICIFYQDKSNYVVFKLKGRAGGFVGNRWSVLLFRSATNRFSTRVRDQNGTILATLTASDGCAGLQTKVNTNANTSPIVQMTVVGTIDNDTDFSADLNDYCFFIGGS